MGRIQSNYLTSKKPKSQSVSQTSDRTYTKMRHELVSIGWPIPFAWFHHLLVPEIFVFFMPAGDQNSHHVYQSERAPFISQSSAMGSSGVGVFEHFLDGSE